MSAEEAHWIAEEVHHVDDPSSGLRAFIVLHSTALGPAFGGIRCKSYANDADAEQDATGLAEAMSWKCALAGLGGGGKATVRADRIKDRHAAFAALGEFVESLGGRFMTAGDYGTTKEDLGVLCSRSRFVADEEKTGDLAAASAVGLVAAMEAVAERLGASHLSELSISVQGLGTIGGGLVRALSALGAIPVVADPDERAVRAIVEDCDVRVVRPEALLSEKVDLFAPCAMGGVLDLHAARHLSARAVVSGANRTLQGRDAGEILWQRGVLFPPDFVTNAGAVIRGAFQMLHGQPATDEEIRKIGARVHSILDEAETHDETPEAVALRRAQKRIQQS